MFLLSHQASLWEKFHRMLPLSCNWIDTYSLICIFVIIIGAKMAKSSLLTRFCSSMKMTVQLMGRELGVRWLTKWSRRTILSWRTRTLRMMERKLFLLWVLSHKSRMNLSWCLRIFPLGGLYNFLLFLIIHWFTQIGLTCCSTILC